MSKIKLQKIVGNLLHISVENCTCEWNDHLEIFSRPQAIENFRQFCFSEPIFHRKQSLATPDD